MNNIKEMVKPGKKVKFQFYKQNELWYVTDCGFEFPVPTYDTGDGVFLAEDKAMLFMRYIRKHIKYLEDAKKEIQDTVDHLVNYPLDINPSRGVGAVFDRPDLQKEPLPETKPDPNIMKEEDFSWYGGQVDDNVLKVIAELNKEANKNPADFVGGPLEYPEDFDSTIE